MAKRKIKGITESQLSNIDMIAMFGSDKQEVIDLNDTEATVDILAARYTLLLRQSAESKNVISSGQGVEQFYPTDIIRNGNRLKVDIMIVDYMEFQSEGVDGWGKSKGGAYKFKSKGTPKEMIQSVKEWLNREGQITRLSTNKSRKKITDEAESKAKSVAFMIKRQGIKPKKFKEDAYSQMVEITENELSNAIQVDIINNLFSR